MTYDHHKTEIADCLVPIVIGVTGHRDIPSRDRQDLAVAIKNIFDETKEQFPHSPIVLLSPLAEGGDRIAAAVALECGVQLICPLPLPVDEYRKDFTSKASIEEFERLLTSATSLFEVSCSHDKHVGERNVKYEAVGMYVAQHAQIMIALWEGVHVDKIGGTSQIVKYRLQGLPRLESGGFRLSEDEGGPVKHILTRRMSNLDLPGELFSLTTLYPDTWADLKKAKEYFDGILRSIDDFNETIINDSKRLAKHTEQSKHYLMPPSEYDSLSDGMKTLVGRFAIADSEANHYRVKRVQTILRLLFLVVLAFFFFKVYLEFFPDSPFVLLLYPLLLLAGSIIYRHATKNRFEQRHEDFRALAEISRIQLFWDIAGVCEDVSDHFLRKHKGELDWIQTASKNWNLPTSLHPDQREEQDLTEKAVKYWVTDQAEWFKKKAHSNQRMVEQRERQANILFFVGMGLAAGLFGSHFIDREHLGIDRDVAEVLRGTVILMLELSLVIAAAIHGYTVKLAMSEQAKNYSRMSSLFHIAVKELSRSEFANDTRKRRLILLELGKEALFEIGDWILLHRSRPMETPKG